MSATSYLDHEKLLAAFEGLFDGHAYLHRNQTLGNYVAAHFYEDLLALNRSAKFSQRVVARNRVLNRDVRVHHAERYVSYEKKRKFPTDGKTYRHPIQEATAAIARVIAGAKPFFDEMLFLPFIAVNVAPYAFSWQNLTQTRNDYAAVLLRISTEYEKRF